jgi:hypothetical protein
MTSGIVIIGCGARKLSHPAPAAELYTGPYFRDCLATARVLAGDHNVLILSARHGLLGLADVIGPYDLSMGQPGSVTAVIVAWQAEARGLLGSPVTALCGARYVRVLREVWPDVRTPLAGLGIGQQRHQLAVMRGALPP